MIPFVLLKQETTFKFDKKVQHIFSMFPKISIFFLGKVSSPQPQNL